LEATVSTYELQKIDAAQRDLLTGFGVHYHPWGEQNVLIDGEDHLELALQVLDLKINKRKASQDGLVTLVLKSGYTPSEHLSAASQSATTTPQTATATPVPVPVTETRPARTGHEADRARYVALCRKRLAKEIKAAQKNFKRTSKVFKRAAQAFLESVRQSTFGGDVSQPDLEARFAEEFDRTVALDKVLKVSVTNNGYTVFTDTLFAVAPDTNKRYEIGNFLIHIRPTGETAGVFLINRTRRVDAVRPGMNAPYVYGDGTAVTDDVTEVLMELLGRGEISALVDLAIQYIETVQPENPLTADLNKWPEVVL
jgi:hypothetical protein